MRASLSDPSSKANELVGKIKGFLQEARVDYGLSLTLGGGELPFEIE